MILSIIASKNWPIKTLDVKNAFLQSETITRDIYVLPPKEAETVSLWKLNKPVYGLKEASKKWYLTVLHVLLKLGFTKSRFDEALFFWKKNSITEGILGTHVDDCTFGGN